MCWIHVDLWSQKFLQRYQIDAWSRAWMVLENYLGYCFAPIFTCNSHCVFGDMEGSQVSLFFVRYSHQLELIILLKWTKLTSLEITIFGLKMMVKSG